MLKKEREQVKESKMRKIKDEFVKKEPDLKIGNITTASTSTMAIMRKESTCIFVQVGVERETKSPEVR